MATESLNWVKRHALLTALIPGIMFTLAIILVRLDHKAEVTFYKEVKHPGYETSPAIYKVEASPHKKWADYFKGYWWLVILGYAVSVGGTYLYVYWVNKEVKQGNWWVLIASWFIGGAMIFALYSAKHSGDVKYGVNVPPATYEKYKGNLDQLFK